MTAPENGTAATHAPTGVLLLRAWLEPEAADGLRVRLVDLQDPSARVRPVATASDVESALAGVRAWLVAFAARHDATGQ
jgi:hypothetical protein